MSEHVRLPTASGVLLYRRRWFVCPALSIAIGSGDVICPFISKICWPWTRTEPVSFPLLCMNICQVDSVRVQTMSVLMAQVPCLRCGWSVLPVISLQSRMCFAERLWLRLPTVLVYARLKIVYDLMLSYRAASDTDTALMTPRRLLNCSTHCLSKSLTINYTYYSRYYQRTLKSDTIVALVPSSHDY